MDAEKYMDMQYIINILEKNKGKKIILFGGGTAGKVIRDKIAEDYEIAYIIDNNQKLWETSADGLMIYSPEVIKEEEKGTFIVLIAGRYAVGMSKQLNGYGLEKDRDYYDVYLAFEFYFRLMKAIGTKDKFLDFIKTIPDNAFDRHSDNSGKKLAVVAKARIVGQETCFDIALFLILKYWGYDVTLIVDTQYNGDDFSIGEYATAEADKIADEIAAILSERFSELKIEKIDNNSPKSNLSGQDISEVKRLTHLNAVWQRSVLNANTINTSDEELENIFYHMLLDNMARIDCYFQNERYEAVVVQSGTQYQSGIYTYVGKKYGMRVPSYDGFGEFCSSFWSTQAPCCYQLDIAKVIREDMLKEPLKRILAVEGKKAFEHRIHATKNALTGDYQIVKRGDSNIEPYDIVMPLNVMWDGSAIGLERLFQTSEEWVMETIKYVIENTDARIVVREHPAESSLNDYNNKSITENIRAEYEGNNRIWIVKSGDPVNSYDLIENCKVVLPLASTLGVEAALFNKYVITHTRCFYDTLSFTADSKTKEEYFNNIKKGLKQKDFQLTEEQKNEAYLTLCLIMNNTVHTEFNETTSQWTKYGFDELLKKEGVKTIVDIIAEDRPACYQNVVSKYSKEEAGQSV